MKSAIKQPWITIGYELFAQEGPKGLKIEVLARKMNKNKSSFYHLFADIEIFISELLEHHIEQSKAIAQQSSLCQNIHPDLIQVLFNIKEDILFNKHLRIHRDNPAYNKCIVDAYKIIKDGMLPILIEVLELSSKKQLASQIFDLAIDNFYLQSTDKNLTNEWLSNYFNEIIKMISAMKISNQWQNER